MSGQALKEISVQKEELGRKEEMLVALKDMSLQKQMERDDTIHDLRIQIERAEAKRDALQVEFESV